MSSRKQLLDEFDKNVAGLRTALSNSSDESLMKNWSFMAGDKTLFNMPRAAMIRSFCLNHIIHHRAENIERLIGHSPTSSSRDT